MDQRDSELLAPALPFIGGLLVGNQIVNPAQIGKTNERRAIELGMIRQENKRPRLLEHGTLALGFIFTRIEDLSVLVDPLAAEQHDVDAVFRERLASRLPYQGERTRIELASRRDNGRPRINELPEYRNGVGKDYEIVPVLEQLSHLKRGRARIKRDD